LVDLVDDFPQRLPQSGAHDGRQVAEADLTQVNDPRLTLGFTVHPGQGTGVGSLVAGASVTVGLGGGRLDRVDLDGEDRGDPVGDGLGERHQDVETSGRGGRHVDRGGGWYGCQVVTLRAGAGRSTPDPDGVGDTAGSGRGTRSASQPPI
jgi:hypothetical protein